MYSTEIFFRILLVGIGFDQWEVGFRRKLGWEMGLVAR